MMGQMLTHTGPITMFKGLLSVIKGMANAIHVIDTMSKTGGAG